jgi:hypothetical protein
MGSEWDLRIESPDHKSPHWSLYSNHHVPWWETSPWLWVGTIPEPSLPYAATHWIEVLDLRKNTSGKQLKFWLKFFLFWFVLIYFSTLDLGNVVLFFIFSLVLLFFFGDYTFVPWHTPFSIKFWPVSLFLLSYFYHLFILYFCLEIEQLS